MADYRKLFEQELLKNQAPDPLQQKMEAEIMKNQGPSLAPTLSLIDHFSGTNLAAQAPKQESMKDKLGQLLGMRQAQQGQRLAGLGKLAQMQDQASMRAQDMEFKRMMLGQQMALAKAKLAKAGGQKLGSEDKKALGYTQSLQRDLEAYKEALKGAGAFNGIRPGMWTGLAGDTPVTALRKALVENYGRLQSGGAISGDEEKRFGDLFGSMNDSPEIMQQKLNRIQDEINQKSALYGGGAYTPSRLPSGGKGGNSGLDLTQMDLDGMSDEEIMALSGMI